MSNVTRISDKLLSFDFTPVVPGKYEVTLGNGASAALQVAPADPKDAIKTVDPDAMKVTASQSSTITPAYPGLSPLAVTVDGRIWIPGWTKYSDLLDSTVKQMQTSERVSSGGYYASGDGSMALLSPNYCCQPRPPWRVYKVADASLTNPMGATDPWYDIDVNANGTRVMCQSQGRVWDERWELLGQLPNPSDSAKYHMRLALSPDGTRIAALATKNSKVLRIDVFNTTHHVPGTTRFQRAGSITPTSASADCGPQGYGCTSYGQLIVSQDNKWVFWMGNKKVQVFRMP